MEMFKYLLDDVILSIPLSIFFCIPYQKGITDDPIAGYEIYNSLFINSPNSVNLVYIGLFYKASPNNCHTGVVESESEINENR